MADQASREADRLRIEGNNFFKRKEYEKAAELYTQSLAKQETSVTLSNRAFAYIKLGRNHKAYVDAFEAIELDKDNMKAHFRKALALIELKRPKEAIRSLEVCLKLCPENLELMALLEKTGKPIHQPPKSNENNEFAMVLADKRCSLVTGVPFLLFKNLGSGPLCAKTWEECSNQLRNCHKPLEKAVIGGYKLDNTVMDFFRSVESARLTKELAFIDFSATRLLFTELFGEIVRPKIIKLVCMQGLSGELLSMSLNKLAGFKTADLLNISASEPIVNFKLNVDDIVEFLHHYEPARRRVVCLQSEFFEDELDVIVDKFLKIFASDKGRSQLELTISCAPMTKMPKECRIINSVTGEIMSVQHGYYNTGVLSRYTSDLKFHAGPLVTIQRI